MAAMAAPKYQFSQPMRVLLLNGYKYITIKINRTK